MIDKARIRKECLALREALSQSQITAKSRSIHERVSAIPEFEEAAQYLIYVSKDSEVDTRPMISRLLRNERTVLVPIVEQGGTLRWSRLESLDELVPGAFGVPEPRDVCRRLVEPANDALAVVPCVAFAPSGHRLGYGKGYFDRFLAQHRGQTIGLAFDCQRVEDIPIEAHDIALDKIVTESQTHSQGS